MQVIKTRTEVRVFILLLGTNKIVCPQERFAAGALRQECQRRQVEIQFEELDGQKGWLLPVQNLPARESSPDPDASDLSHQTGTHTHLLCRRRQIFVGRSVLIEQRDAQGPGAVEGEHGTCRHSVGRCELRQRHHQRTFDGPDETLKRNGQSHPVGRGHRETVSVPVLEGDAGQLGPGELHLDLGLHERGNKHDYQHEQNLLHDTPPLFIRPIPSEPGKINFSSLRLQIIIILCIIQYSAFYREIKLSFLIFTLPAFFTILPYFSILILSYIL